MISSVDQCHGTPDYVIEVAGQAAVKEHAQKVLEKGWTIGLISVGTLADNEFLTLLKLTAEQHHAHLHLLAGAIAGIDGISAAKEGGWKRSPIRAVRVQTVGVVAMQNSWLTLNM